VELQVRVDDVGLVASEQCQDELHRHCHAL
jgi:hypothetical protein